MSLDFIIHTHNLPARSQHTHWGHRFAWKHEGRNVRLGVPPEVSRSNVTCDLDGNVMRMTKTVLRPCFGSPTAYLVHGGDQFYWGKKGYQRTRCNACPAKEGCAAVGHARLRSSQSISAAHDNFEKLGGREALKQSRKSRDSTQIGRAYRDVLTALNGHGSFESVNDPRIEAHIDAELSKRRDAEFADQKRRVDRDRADRLSRGDFDADLLDRMFRERVYRRVLFGLAQKEIGAPAWLERSKDGARFASRVWFVKTLLLIAGREPNPSLIASELIARELVPTRNHNSLRARVGKALERIVRLEAAVPPGRSGPIWEKADLNALTTPDGLTD
jgi:hypothetical protein